jgi:membrane protein implicated in regulation of membrane protease activity
MSDLTWIEIIYWASTIIGGTLFILRLVMLFMGGGVSDDTLDTALDSGDLHASGDHGDADVSFKLLSLQGLTAFFMMFGLVGLALLKAGLYVFVTVVGGALAGLATVVIISVIFTQMKRLQTDGTLNIQNTVGKDGDVYLTIPKNGSGQVQVIVQGSLKIFDAVSSNKALIATGEKIRVVGVQGGNTLLVEKTK